MSSVNKVKNICSGNWVLFVWSTRRYSASNPAIFESKWFKVSPDNSQMILIAAVASHFHLSVAGSACLAYRVTNFIFGLIKTFITGCHGLSIFVDPFLFVLKQIIPTRSG